MLQQHRLLVALALALAAACPAPPKDDDPPPPPPPVPATVTLQVLAFNDLHGQLLPAHVDDHDVGGAALLAGALRDAREKGATEGVTTSFTVGAGDLIGASPLESSLFHDDPTIDAVNVMGLDLSAVGNHEFDEGVDELLRMQNGGCNAVDGCAFDDAFAGGSFTYLAANVYDKRTHNRIFPPYAIEDVIVENGAPIKVAFVGLATIATPFTTIGANVADLTFEDEADTVRAFVPELHAQGADVIVVLIHEGGAQEVPGTVDDNGCASFHGRINDVVRRMPSEVKLVVSGHSHARYNCVVQNDDDGADIALTSAGAKGQLLTDVRFTFDTSTGAVTDVLAHNSVVDDSIAVDADVQAIVEAAQAASAPLADRVIGNITADITRARDDSGEAAVGEAIADAFLFATQAAPASAEVGIMNTGGERADFAFQRSGGEEVDGQVTFGEAFRVQPFQNTLVTVTLTGAELQQMLEEAADSRGPGIDVAGVHYTIHSGLFSNTVHDVTVGGVALDVDATYRVSTNSFLADPLSGYPELAGGSDLVVTGFDVDAVVTYFGEAGPISPPPLDRIDLE